jgi:hypothetical protein
MAQLELSRFTTSPDKFRLFKEDGDEVTLPGESEWEYDDAENGWSLEMSKLSFPLDSGQYWLVAHNNNATYLEKVTVGDKVVREVVSGVANGFEGQHAELFTAAKVAPRGAVDTMIELSGGKTNIPTEVELRKAINQCERGCRTEADYRRKLAALEITKGLEFDIDWREAEQGFPAYAAHTSVFITDVMRGPTMLFMA